jgi:hypothetical protein
VIYVVPKSMPTTNRSFVRSVDPILVLIAAGLPIRDLLACAGVPSAGPQYYRLYEVSSIGGRGRSYTYKVKCLAVP